MAGKLRAVAKTLMWTLAKGVALVPVGWAVSGVCFGAGFWVLSTDNSAGYPGAGAGPLGAVAALLMLFAQRPWAMSAMVVGVVGVAVHVVLAQKFVVQCAMSWAWKAGESKFLEPLVERSVAGVDRASPGWMTEIVKWGALKANLLGALRKDPESGAFRKWLYGKILGKLRVEDELPVGREALTGFLVERIRSFMAEIVEPSMTLSGVVMFGQLMLAAVAVLVEGR
ncbi:MAG: hypothetical protein RL173_3055 [Fibrobacterota bacterium]|jgi:hypothetical protein